MPLYIHWNSVCHSGLKRRFQSWKLQKMGLEGLVQLSPEAKLINAFGSRGKES